VRTPTASKALVAAFAAVLIALPRVAWAAESDVEELRREVRQLQAQIQRLSTAISEAAEFDRQRAALLTRALKNLGSVPPVDAAPARSDRSERIEKSEAPPRVSAPPPPRGESVATARRSSPPPAASSEPTSTGTIRGKLTVPAGEPVAYVYVENVLAPSAKGQRKVIEQAGKKFVPNWAVIQRGTAITFPNNDNIYHNVFSLSAGNSFDLGLYNSDGEAKAHTFTEAGPVDVYCNIHPQMAASVLVVPNKHFAKVKADGSFELAGVPTGRRKVVAWAPGSRIASDWVEVASGANIDINLRLESKAPSHKNKAGQTYGSYE
jgi:plastocyanin